MTARNTVDIQYTEWTLGKWIGYFGNYAVKIEELGPCVYWFEVQQNYVRVADVYSFRKGRYLRNFDQADQSARMIIYKLQYGRYKPGATTN